MNKIKIFNKDENIAIILSGIFALIVGVGVARFVFTSLLPPMLEDYLSLNFAGILSSLNYVGYLAGAIFAIFIKDMNKKIFYFRIGLILCVLTTFVLAFSLNEALWLVSRIIAGFAAAMALVVGSAIVMSRLKIENKTKAMGIHFSGIGFSVLVSDLIVRFVFAFNGTWADAWFYLALFAIPLSLYSIYILEPIKNNGTNVKSHKFDKSLFTPFVIILIFAYFTEGAGMVVQGTFLPDIINNIKALEGLGNLAWTLVGLAAIPSCIFWMIMASRFGSVNIIIIVMLLQVVGILIPTFTDNLYLNLISGLLYGGTFVALVALFMNLGGKLAGSNPVILMGAITTAYGIGQVSAPLYSVYLVDMFDSYDYALYLTAFLVFMGALSLYITKILKLKGE